MINNLSLNKKRILILFFDALLVALYFVLKVVSRMMLDATTQCVYLSQGLYCPTCGGTRCVINFLNGDFSSAFLFNPFVFCVIIYLIVVVIFLNLEFLLNLDFAKKTRRIITNYKAIILIAVLYAVYAIARIVF